MRRVVVTGMGAVTPLGNTAEEFWANIKAGKVGIGPITKFDTTEYRAKVAGEVKDFKADEFMDFKTAKRMEPFSQYAAAAALMAVKDSGVDIEKEDAYRCGVIVGCGVGSMQATEREHKRLLDFGPNKIGPLYIPLMISNMAAGNIAIVTGFKGKNIDVVTACASGTNSIGEAFRSIQNNEADVILAGGTEAAICPMGVAGFCALKALSFSEDPMKASIPFDKNRDGFVLGEGAGVIVLEEYEHAKARGAKIYAEMVGYGATCDAYHITSPEESGIGAAHAMMAAIADAGIEPSQIDYINAHGTSTHHNDLFETRAIKTALGDAAKTVKINSTKSMTGHLLGAAGAIEAIVLAKSCEEGFIHQTMGSSETEEEMDLNYCFGRSYEQDVNYAMSNSLGFGGHNASIIMKHFEE
ncbi:MAG: beta-ketoacyl-ACP synthase II [Clostridiales bacterium]|nr:beta-ketoacyl-ACP synthase II [Clostridiales bacterium]MBQ5966730.1 beta-ketoacyl-ACP synthase II [Clostridiales bacterium]MBQ6270623.1 beta-ketoacyl-ACP synthase II [Clostridiales bacterium]